MRKKCFRMDVIEKMINEDLIRSLDRDPLENTLMGDDVLDDPKFVDYLHMLDVFPRVSRFNAHCIK